MSKSTLFKLIQTDGIYSTYTVTDELYTDCGSSGFSLGTTKRCFLGGSDMVIRTAASGGGTLLVENTDYTITEEDFSYSELIGYHVYTQVIITNASYQSGNLYFSYKPYFSYTDPLSLEMLVPIGSIKKYIGASAPYSNWLLCDGSAISRTTYSELFALMPYLSQTITVSIASPGVVTMTAHGLQTGQQIQFSTTGALPTGITAGTVYFVRWASADTFHLYDTEAHAVNTAATTGIVNTSGSQSGVHTGVAYKWGNGDGSTTFNIPDFRGTSVAGVGTSGSGYLASETFVLGAKYNDQMQGHRFGSGGNAVGTQANMNDSGSIETARINASTKLEIMTDGTNGTPRTGTVTRGKVVGVNFIIRVL